MNGPGQNVANNDEDGFPMPMILMLVTNQPDIAQEAQSAGIDRIFVDLEILGKRDRQGHLDTVISSHSLDDIPKIRNVLDRSDLLVRINPFHEGTGFEITEAISRGADILMLPMFKTAKEVVFFVKQVNKRATTNLLLETPQALVRIDEILEVEGIDEIHIGLNDLHLGMGLDFMFELLSGGIIDYLSEKIKPKGIRFGFGGVARIGQGTLPADMILAEHYRLGSEMVILSRDFHGRATTIEQLRKNLDLKFEVSKIRDYEKILLDRTPEEFQIIREEIIRRIRNIVKNIAP